MGLRKVFHPLTCYVDFPEQLLLYEAQGVDDGSCVDDKGDPLTGTVQQRHISDVPFQDFHLSLTLELCKGSRKQSESPPRHPQKSTERSGEGLWGGCRCPWTVLTTQTGEHSFKAGKAGGIFQWLYCQVRITALWKSVLHYLSHFWS